MLRDATAESIRPDDKPIADGMVTGLRLHPTKIKRCGQWKIRYVSPNTGKHRDYGIGIVLTGEVLTKIETGQPLFLIGVDLDNVQTSAKKIDQAKAVCESIGSYAEKSPSGTGIQIFALSEKIVGKGQSPSGEMYNSGDFLR